MKNLSLLFVVVFVQFVFAQTPVFQDTKGDLSVSNSGTLNYSVPIAVPPGLNGTSPNITLSYNSGNNNGVAGYGWNISGLSAISRVNSRLDLDGKINSFDGENISSTTNNGVVVKNYDLSTLDQFSLDGQRLIFKKDNILANSTIEFETENYSNAKIQAVVNMMGKPCMPRFGAPPGMCNNKIVDHTIESFRVTSPNGSTTNYNGSITGPFNIKNTVDAFGNTIDYVYTGDYISEIKWGRNANVSSAGVDNVMKFIYKNRDRIEYSSILNNSKIADKILDRIEVYSQGKLFKKYVLTHETIHGNYQRLKQVQEFNSANEGANPVIFTYNDTPKTFTDLGYYKSPTSVSLSDIQLKGDFDGNGETDFIADNKLYLNSITNNNTWNPIEFPAGFDASKNMATINNMTTDGKIAPNQYIAKFILNKLDVYDQNKLAYTQNYNMPLANRNITIEYHRGPLSYLDDAVRICKEDQRIIDFKNDLIKNNVGQIYEGDFDGDGISELLYKMPFRPKLKVVPNLIYGVGIRCSIFNAEYIENGNYLLDIRQVTANPGKRMFNKVENLPIGKGVFIIDFNGDGKDDIVDINNDTKEIKAYNVSINNEAETTNAQIIGQSTMNEFDFEKQNVLGDFNGDGKIDILIPEAVDSSNWFLYTYDNKFGTKKTITV